MIMAIRVAELQCIHYSGNDLVIQTQLVELGEGMVCDNLPPDLRRKAQRMESEKLRRWRQAKHASIWMAILNWFGYRR